ncbi:hypothetical protein [Streptomyces lavendulae]|uniref:hypothetical protein n=1 Tax=Streptomyces lavendulae TaxID=1914 RepID=UPI0024A20E19|nr:hypothetical protein [Streptomyces lavendulae]GLX22057.1 hypothetical protein Slala01_57010 [Streptomyces lavendulae subsp. lavendulae]GLX29765.1 hypothetical protein Slala02_55850 [Streptomyces lavendulae subsp. lavendulae]
MTSVALTRRAPAAVPLTLRVPLTATGCALPAYAVWAAVLATGGGDLAAQTAWADFAARHPGSAYDLAWHGGLHTAAYSLVSPYAMALFGVVPVTVAAGLTATWLAALLCVRSGVRAPGRPAAAAALALWCQAASGRTTFLLGVAFGLAALLAALPGGSAVRGPGARDPGSRGGRLAATALCAALSAMASPVAGLFLALTGAALPPAPPRRAATAAALLVPPCAVLALTARLFPFQGEQPMPPERIWPPLLTALAVLAAAPPAWRWARRAAGLYAAAVLLTYAVPSPMGTNVERLAGLAAPALLLAAAGAATGRARRAAAAAGLALCLLWAGGNTAAHLGDTVRVPAWAAETDGVLAELGRLGADRTRVEAVMARSHREAAVLAPYVTLARGWNRQADVERGRLFYGNGGLTPAAYRAWLDRWAVGLVVVHDGPPDAASEAERALVADRPAYLEPVWQDRNWRIYRVRDAVPLVDPPARVRSSDAAAITVRVPRPGTVTVRIVDSPWLTADSGCLEPMRGTRGDGFVRLTVRRPGDVTIGSAYLSEGRRCAP